MDEPGDWLDVTLYLRAGRVCGLRINYVAIIRGVAHVVCRYDTCRGHLHVHREWLAQDAPKDLEPPDKPAMDYRRAVDKIHDDLACNWRAYRAKMELM